MLYLHQIFSSIWMINPDYVANYLPLIAAHLKGEPISISPQPTNKNENAIQFATIKNDTYTISEYGVEQSPEVAPEGSVAIISIRGSITKHDQDCGPAGMLTKANLLERCYANDNIKSVILRIDSGGGSAFAMMHMTEKIAQRNKPVLAYVEDAAYSAAYGICSACDMIVANNKLAGIGSIGSYITIADYAEYYKNMGIKLIEVYATKSSDKNKMYYEAINGNKKLLQEYIDTFNEEFLSMVEKNRGENLTTDKNTWSSGKEFFAEKALEIGLIDSIDSFENVLNYFNI